MKRLLLIILSVFVAAIGLGGCANSRSANDGFVEVCSVTVDGETTYSRVVSYLNDITEITKDEFDEAEGEKPTGMPKSPSSWNLNTDKSNNPKHAKGEVLFSKYQSPPPIETHYYRYVFSHFEYRYVSVKVVSDKQIYVKTYDNITTLYSTDSYSVVYFK